MHQFHRLSALALLAAAAVFGQSSGILKGRLTDPSGAVIPGGTVTVSGERGFVKTTTTDVGGTFSFAGVPAGKYTVRASAVGFSLYENTAVEVAASQTATLDIPLQVALAKQEVTVKGEPAGLVSTEPSNNAGSLTLRSEDLDSLPDDPDDLQADLTALAGPSAGPSGGQIYIDGFSGAQLPPKSAIREIRINQNPFSAEYDRLGFGRIEILTKPGSDKFHGQGFFNFGDAIFNARNPFAPTRPPFQERLFGGSFSGPLNKRASFFLNAERREIDDDAVINATILDPNLGISPFSQAVQTPNRRTSISPRLDYQLSTNHTLVARYHFVDIGQQDYGIGTFSLLSRAYNRDQTEHVMQLTETAVVSPHAVNETRLEFVRTAIDQLGNNTVPTVNVLQSFTGGGSQIGHSYNNNDRWELQNYTTISHGTHSLKVGARLRADRLYDVSPQNFGGTYTFAGTFGPELDANLQPVLSGAGQPVMTQVTSIEQYRRTLLFQQMGLAATQIRALGGGASQFSIAGGNPATQVSQVDLGVFAQDDWRLRPNFTLSLGLRYETQTNIHDWRDLAPRLGFAWAPGARGNARGKTVVRGGFGIFYDRFADNLTLQAIRFNGLNQQQYIVTNPDFYPVIPPLATLTAEQQPPAITRVASNLRAPYVMQTAIGIERQLPFNTTIASTFTNSRADHLLRTRDINAPLPGTFNPNVPGSGLRPFGPDNIFLYETSGVLNQHQWITNINSRVSSKLTLFAFYVYNRAFSNTDGVGTYPADPYNESIEYGRSSLDIRHRFVLGGSMVSPGGIRFSPFVIAHSGSPFNITLGRDLNGDTIFADRPAFATDLTKSSVVATPYGTFDTNPAAGQTVIPRNFGQGPAFFTFNLRLSKTFGFGGSSAPRGGSSFGGGRGGHGGPGPGAMRMGGMHGIFGDAATEKRYNLVLSISARNLFNTVNLAMPIGTITSPMFGQSNALATSWGPAAASANRRLEMQLRFSF